MTNSIIRLENVIKEYKNGDNLNTVINKVSLDVKEGDFVSIMGPSGSGKSTLLYLIGGIEKPNSGKIIIDGKDILSMNDIELSRVRRKSIGFVFQFYNLVPNLTVEENIMVPIIMDTGIPSLYKKRVKELLELTNLTEKAKAYPNELSGGQQQRVAIARALVMKPKIILADEPTGNLDQKSSSDIMNLFKKINEEQDVTILQVTHSEQIAKVAKKIMVMNDGVLSET